MNKELIRPESIKDQIGCLEKRRALLEKELNEINGKLEYLKSQLENSPGISDISLEEEIYRNRGREIKD